MKGHGEERWVVSPSSEDKLKMFGEIPVQQSGSALECLCCYTVCSRCKCGNAIDVKSLLE